MGRFDFLVIGSGPAGRRAAIQAAKLGKRVALITCEMMGGVSVHTGTIPSKTLREAILYFTGWRQRGFYGRGHRLKKQITVGDLLQRITMTIGHEVEVLKDQLRRSLLVFLSYYTLIPTAGRGAFFHCMHLRWAL